MAAALGQTQSFLPVTGAAHRWQLALGHPQGMWLQGDTVGSGDAPDSGLLVRQRQPLAGTRRLWGRNANIFITSLPLTPGQQ